MHFLFFVSIVLMILSSLFLTNIFAKKEKDIKVLICYFIIILFAQIIGTCEFLSLFKAWTPVLFTTLNFLFFVAVFSTGIFLFKSEFAKFELFDTAKIEIKNFIEKLKFALRADEYLKIIFYAYLFFLVMSLWQVFILPVNDPDALTYHLARIPFWIENKAIYHFVTADIRNLIMPVNSELIASVGYLFIKSDILVRISSFVSYILYLIGLCGILSELKFSFVTKLRVCLTVSAFTSVLFAISGSESSIICAGLITAAIFLFFRASKTDKMTPLYFSSLLYAVAAGVKTPAVQAVFSLIFVFCAFEYVSPKRNFLKHCGLFALFFGFNFVLFGAYNYVLNYLSFGNFLSSPGALLSHKFYGGIKGFIANFTKYCFALLDCSGIPGADKIWRILTGISNIVIALMGIDFDSGSLMSNMNHLKGANLHENTCGLGILGIIVFLPSLIIAFRKVNFSKTRKTILFAFATGFLINLVVLSLSVGYMIFNIRFIVMFAMLAAPVIVLFRPGKYLKTIVTALSVWIFTIFFMIFPARFNYLRIWDFINVSKCNINAFKQHVKMYPSVQAPDYSQAVRLINDVKPGSRVLLFLPSNISTYRLSENFENPVFALWELTEQNPVDYDKFDYIVTGFEQISTYFKGAAPKTVKCLYTDWDGTSYRPEQINKIIFTACYPDLKILEQKGFKQVGQYMGDNDKEKILYLYKKIN